MTKDGMGTVIRAASLTNYFEVAAQVAFDPDPLLARLRLNRSELADSEARIDAGTVIALLEESARLSGSPTFGLRMAESRQLADFGVVSLLFKHQRTLRDALRALIEYRRLVNPAVAIHVEAAGELVILRQEIIADYAGSIRQATELALGVLSRMCNSLIASRWHPYSVNFTHDAPPDLQVHRRVFKAHLEFASDFNGIVCKAADLDLPNPVADPALARHAQRFIDSIPGAHDTSIVLDVRGAVALLLPAGRATIEPVAQRLGMNVRTLQRRLEDSGAVFSDIVNDVRRDLAVRYMDAPGYSVSRIAELLGYSTPGSFTRWFSAQFGASPVRWRETRQQQ
jgi:AraC-like DNA-binding protein